MKEIMVVAAMAAGVMVFSGCSTLERMGILAESFIVAQIEANVPGEYAVKIEKVDEPGRYSASWSKDGTVYRVDQWKCDGFIEGKLSGCHTL